MQCSKCHSPIEYSGDESNKSALARDARAMQDTHTEERGWRKKLWKSMEFLEICQVLEGIHSDGDQFAFDGEGKQSMSIDGAV